eukprot:4364660-Prymnesium_polylepis.1
MKRSPPAGHYTHAPLHRAVELPRSHLPLLPSPFARGRHLRGRGARAALNRRAGRGARVVVHGRGRAGDG